MIKSSSNFVISIPSRFSLSNIFKVVIANQSLFLVNELIGSSVSLITGDYSRGASGFWIENGTISYPVAEATIAGNLKEMFLKLHVANDLDLSHSIASPTILIENMTVAGI